MKAIMLNMYEICQGKRDAKGEQERDNIAFITVFILIPFYSAILRITMIFCYVVPNSFGILSSQASRRHSCRLLPALVVVVVGIALLFMCGSNINDVQVVPECNSANVKRTIGHTLTLD